MQLPIVAIVGRPNVGKSTLVNRLAQTHEAIVHETSGVTRDRSYHEADWNGVTFMLVDTGGVEMTDEDVFQDSISQQALLAAEEADVIVFLTDGPSGITGTDSEVARILKRMDAPVILAVNRMDDPADESALWEFYNLGLGDPVAISAIHGHGTGDLLDSIVEKLPEFEPVAETPALNVAIIGRPNAGKSSLTNKMLGEERSIVSDIGGTTRDAIDTLVEHEGTLYRLIDTAGLRRQAKVEGIEYYGFLRAIRAMERAQVALLVVDSEVGLTDQDQRVAALADEKGLGLIILLNKWDLITTEEERTALLSKLEDRFMYVAYAPVIRISALTGRSVHRIWEAINAVAEIRASKIPTSKLNELLSEMRDFGHTVTKGNRKLRMNYITQTGVEPPRFTIFCNHPDLVDESFERYIENRLRSTFDFTGTPIRLKFRKKG